MDFSELIELGSQNEISVIIEKGALCGGSILQASDVEEIGNQISRISNIIHDQSEHKVILNLLSAIDLDLQKPIYIQLNYRRTTFRIPAGKFHASGDKIICDFPREVHSLTERNGGDRYLILPSSQLSLSLKRAERNVRELTHEMEVRIVDVSKQGFGIVISSYNRDYFKENDYFWLRAVNHKELRSPILGTVCYVSSTTTKHGQVRVGLSLSFNLDNEILEELKRESLTVLAA